MQDNIKDYIESLNGEFIAIQGGSFVNIGTGEIFTKTEVTKYIQIKLEEFNIVRMAEVKQSASEYGVDIDQNILNKRSQKKKSKTKDRYDGGEFNMIYRERMGDLMALKLNATEKGVWYSLGELATFPTNTVHMKGNIPLYEDIAEYIGMSERNLRRYLSVLEEKNLIKITTFGFRKAIVINPEYYATGKDLDIETLKLFNILECDDEKINSYV